MNKNTYNQNMELSPELLRRYKSHSRPKNHKSHSVPVVVPIKIGTTTYLNSFAANRKSTKMELSLELCFNLKRHTVSEHNRKQYRVDIEDSTK